MPDYGPVFMQMNKPDDKNAVSVKVMWKNEPGGQNYLLHWVAGVFVTEDDRKPPEYGDRWGSSTYVIRNDDLFNQIVCGFKRDLLHRKELGENQRRKLKLNCSAFVVIEDQCSAVPSIDLDRSIRPTITCESSGTQTFVYQHSKNKELKIKILEPSSPADVGYFPYDQENPAMKENLDYGPRGDRQCKLENEHIRIFHLLRSLDDTDGVRMSESTLTAIVSTLIDNETTEGLKSAVFLTHGLSVDSGLGRLEVETCPGWMTTTRFLTNNGFAESLDRDWKCAAKTIRDEDRRELFLGKRRFGCIDIESLQRRDYRRLKIPDPGRFANDGNGLLVSSSNTTFTLWDEGNLFTLETDERTFMGKKGRQNYHFISAYPQTQLRRKGPADVPMRLGLNTSADETSTKVMSPMTICTVTAETMIKQTKSKRSLIEEKPSKTSLSIVITGQQPDIEVPDSMQYNDPLTNISCCRHLVSESHLAQTVKDLWKGDGLDMAIFGVADIETHGIKWKKLQYGASKTVRLKGKPQPVEIWCHSSRINPVYNVIQADEAGRKLLDQITEQPGVAELRKDFITKCLSGKSFPKSFHFPTMSIKFPWLPKPNNLGVHMELGCLMHDKDDGAHFKMATKGKGGLLKTFDNKDLDSLIQHRLLSKDKDKPSKTPRAGANFEV